MNYLNWWYWMVWQWQWILLHSVACLKLYIFTVLRKQTHFFWRKTSANKKVEQNETERNQQRVLTGLWKRAQKLAKEWNQMIAWSRRISSQLAVLYFFLVRFSVSVVRRRFSPTLYIYIYKCLVGKSRRNSGERGFGLGIDARIQHTACVCTTNSFDKDKVNIYSACCT